MNTMKKVLAGLVVTGVVAIAGLIGLVQLQPDTLQVTKTVEVAASPADVRAYARDLQLWNQWSPWSDLDPNVQAAFSTPSAGLGAWYTWEGNDRVGKGRMEVKADEPLKVVHAIQFEQPMEGVAMSTITWSGDAEKTTVTWSFQQEAGFTTKAANLAMDIEGMVGKDYEKGLVRLKPLVEAAAKQRVIHEKQTHAEELVKAAAAAQQAAEEAGRAAQQALAEAAAAAGN